MKFFVEHRTRYDYGGPVYDSINEACLCPCSNELQICHAFDLLIDPPGARVMRRIDFFTNQVHHFELHEPHTVLEVCARSTVETLVDPRDLTLPSPAEGLRGLDRAEAFYDFLSASTRVQLVPMMLHEALEVVGGFDDTRVAVESLMHFVFQHFQYTQGVTAVDTNVSQVFEKGEGVCQDFAHVMIALCRSVQIPARYVSGYFFVDKEAKGTADDNTASHAWVDCYLPGIGWVGYDPTHDRRVDETYIKVAVGRDYADVRPVAGTFRGQSRAEMEVAVTVRKLSE